MNFRIKKRVEYGEAIYVSGNIEALGNWDIKKALRLNWNQKDIWAGSIQLNTIQILRFEYKYFISFWNGPDFSSIFWEDGNYNRIINPKLKQNNQIIDDKWNIQKIELNLMIPQNQDVYNNYSVIGNYIQLGNWKNKIPLTKRNKTIKNSLIQIDTDQDNWEQYNIYTYSFQIYRGRQKFRYYFVRQTGYYCEPQRHPGRLFFLGKLNSHHPDYVKTVYNLGKIQLYEKCNFQFLNFSRINEKLYLGAYPKTIEDIKKLKNVGVKAILSIQTPDDFERHNISQQYFRQACSKQQIQIETCSIKDMDKQDFSQKVEKALQILKKWNGLDYTIYVHCSAGIYRSPQIMILHLIQSYGYEIDKAIELVKQKHPYANPNIELVLNTSEKIVLSKNIETSDTLPASFDKLSTYSSQSDEQQFDQETQEIQTFFQHH